MKSGFLFFLITVVIFPFEKNQAQTSPGFKDIAFTFFKNYTIDPACYLKISHRKDGWHVGKVNYESPDQILEDQLFWSDLNKAYESLLWEKLTVPDSIAQTETESYLKMIDWPALEYDFERMNYFGYPGWNQDVIEYLSDKPNKTDRELETLARAYSNYGSGFLYDQYGDFFLNNDPDRNPLQDDEIISKNRTEKFNSYQAKTLDTYEQLKRQNPLYQTKVGNIAIKFYNEYLYSYVSLNMAGDSVAAELYLKKLDYPDSLVDQAKYYLNSVDKNAILFTAGDNDTYPLIYLQLVENYRPDVLVLNSSLLGFRRYVSIYKKKYPGLISIPDTCFMKKNFDYFLYQEKENEATIEATAFIESLMSNQVNPHESIPYSRGLPVKQYYSKKIYFNDNKEKYISLNSYLFMNDLFIIDIIKNNVSRRSINFTFDHELFSKLLELKNFGYKLIL